MKRVNFHLTDHQHNQLRALSEQDGLSVAEHIRRAIDLYAAEPGIIECPPDRQSAISALEILGRYINKP